MGDPDPEASISGFLSHMLSHLYCEIITIGCFKLLRFGVICYIAIENLYASSFFMARMIKNSRQQQDTFESERRFSRN